eukprot:SAG22_NODE_3510_length_1672_cov_1.221233_2_plen_121_part_00
MVRPYSPVPTGTCRRPHRPGLPGHWPTPAYGGGAAAAAAAPLGAARNRSAIRMTIGVMQAFRNAKDDFLSRAKQIAGQAGAHARVLVHQSAETAAPPAVLAAEMARLAEAGIEVVRGKQV